MRTLSWVLISVLSRLSAPTNKRFILFMTTEYAVYVCLLDIAMNVLQLSIQCNLHEVDIVWTVFAL